MSENERSAEKGKTRERLAVIVWTADDRRDREGKSKMTPYWDDET